MADAYGDFHQFIQEGPGWERMKKELVYANPHVRVYQTETRTPARPDGAKWTVVHRKGAAVIAPVTREGRLLLVRQERIPVGASIWEFPAGQIDGATEHDEAEVRATALRELREETGYELAPEGELIPMGHFYSSPGFTDEHGHLFMARGVIPSPLGTEYDENEAISECRAFTAEEFRQMIANGEIRDANTLSSYARMMALGLMPRM